MILNFPKSIVNVIRYASLKTKLKSYKFPVVNPEECEQVCMFFGFVL